MGLLFVTSELHRSQNSEERFTGYTSGFDESIDKARLASQHTLRVLSCGRSFEIWLEMKSGRSS